MTLESQFKRIAKEVGFDLVGISRIVESGFRQQVEQWVSSGQHGHMDWFAKNLDRRVDPRQHLYGRAMSVVTVGLLYRPAEIPEEVKNDASRGLIARYALYDDYHQVMQQMLKTLISEISPLIRKPWEYRVYVDTGPVLEREVGQSGGLGFVGKNTTLIHTTLGSYFFLGEIICNLPLMPDQPLPASQGTCGRCRRCQDRCPTQAFVGPYQLDARRCISYLTIEYKDEIPEALRPLLKNRIYGCDVCQEVCPWNKRAVQYITDRLQLRKDLSAPYLADLLQLTEDGFTKKFYQSPIERIGWQRFMRNVLVAVGNWRDVSVRREVKIFCTHPDTLISRHARWALQQINTV